MVSGGRAAATYVVQAERNTKRQFTSISVSLTGATLSWQAQETEHARARQILHHLEDHRMLYDPHGDESFEAVVESAERLRSYLSEPIPQCDSVGLRDGLREIQAALREFLTRMPRQEPGDYGTLLDRADGTVNGDLARIVQQGRSDT